MNGFPQNARVCFLGDSITHNNEYVSRIVAYYHDRLPERKVKFFNGGTSGGGVYTILANFDGDVTAHKPTHAVIMIGINDSARWVLEQERGEERYNLIKGRYNAYKKNISELYEKLKQQNIEVIFCTPTPYDEYQQSETPALKGGFALLAEYAEFIRGFAKEKGAQCCDFHGYISHMAQIESIIKPDRVHPNSLGHYHMAKCFLAFQGFDIGEPAPIPKYLDEWREKVSLVRNVRATEHLVVKDYTLSDAMCIEKVKQYLENPTDEPNREYFISLSREYLINKPIQSQLEQEASTLMDELYRE